MSLIDQYASEPFYGCQSPDKAHRGTETIKDGVVLEDDKETWIEFRSLEDETLDEPYTDTSQCVLQLVENVKQHSEPGYCSFTSSLFVEKQGKKIFKPYKLHPNFNSENENFPSTEVEDSVPLHELESLNRNEIQPALEDHSESLKTEVLIPLRDALIPCIVEVYRRKIGFEDEPRMSLYYASYDDRLAWRETLLFILRLWDRIVSGKPLAQIKNKDWFAKAFEYAPKPVSKGTKRAIDYYVSNNVLSRDRILEKALPVYSKWVACREAIYSRIHGQKTEIFTVDAGPEEMGVWSSNDTPAEIKGLLEEAASRRKDALSENTIQTYRYAINDFRKFCERHGLKAIAASPETLIAYFEHLAQEGYAKSTIEKRNSGIRFLHERAMKESPTKSCSVRRFLSDLRKTVPDSRGRGQKDPVLFRHLHQMCFEEEKPSDLRDRAIFYIGVATGLRESELIGLEMKDISEKKGGVVYRIRDPKGEGPEWVSVPHKVPALDPSPNEALNAWIEAAGIESGAIFRSVDRHGKVGDRDGLSSGSIREHVVKPWMKSIGEDPAQYGSHSLRAGLVTQAILGGIVEARIAAQSRHKSIEVLREYQRPKNDMENHILREMGLDARQ
jgi:integrase